MCKITVINISATGDATDFENFEGADLIATSKAVRCNAPRSPLVRGAAKTPKQERSDMDLEVQRQMVAAERRQKQEEWIARNAPAPFSVPTRTHALRNLVLASAQYHRERRSERLHRTVRDIVSGARPDLLEGVPAGKPGLSKELANILFADLETLMKRKGAAFALSSLSELPLWDTRTAKQAAGGRKPRAA
jgi:hypothetical protein